MMRRLDRELRRSVREAEKLKKRNVQLFVSNLNRFLEKQIPKIARLPNNATTAGAVSTLGGLFTGLKEAGLPSVVSEIRKTYTDELSSIATRFDIVGVETSLSSFSKAGVNALIKNDTARVTKLLSPYVDDISSTLLRSVIGGEKIDVYALLDGTTDVLASQLETEVNTMLSSFSRTVTGNRAKELELQHFAYVGPDDKVTRDWCKETLDGAAAAIYTRDEIGLNADGMDAFIYGGGYNCRHRWVAMSEELALEMGWKP